MFVLVSLGVVICMLPWKPAENQRTCYHVFGECSGESRVDIRAITRQRLFLEQSGHVSALVRWNVRQAVWRVL